MVITSEVLVTGHMLIKGRVSNCWKSPGILLLLLEIFV